MLHIHETRSTIIAYELNQKEVEVTVALPAQVVRAICTAVEEIMADRNGTKVQAIQFFRTACRPYSYAGDSPQISLFAAKNIVEAIILAKREEQWS